MPLTYDLMSITCIVMSMKDDVLAPFSKDQLL